jgi:hypothetical protein
MSMLKTLAKVAIGVMVVKGVSGMMQKGKDDKPEPQSRQRGPSIDDILKKRGDPSASTESAKKPGSGTVFGGPHSPRRRGTSTTESGGSVEDMLGGMLGGGGGTGAEKGGLGGALDELSDLSTPGRGRGAPVNTTGGNGSFGDLLNQSFDTFGEPAAPPTAQQEDLARLLLRAMLSAAKSDGKIDRDEKKKLLDSLGDASREEMEFIQAELEKPVDIQALVGATPRGSEQQVYLMSVTAIDLDSKREAEYLHALAQALGIDHATCNAIHRRLGVPTLYS